MATRAAHPYQNIDYPEPGLAADGFRWGMVVGMASLAEFSARAAGSFGAIGATGLHTIVCVEYKKSVIGGRYLLLWPQATSGLTADTIHASERRLLGGQQDAGHDLPDMVSMDFTTFMLDGQGRWNAGSAPATFVLSDDGGVFTDESADAADNGVDDVQLLPASTVAVGDAFYVGVTPSTFAGMYIDVSTFRGGTGSVAVTAEYFNGAAFAALTINGDIQGIADGFQDESQAQGESQVHPLRLTWNIPGDWVSTSVDGNAAFWVRLRVTSVSGLGSYVSPKATKVLVMETGTNLLGLSPACLQVTGNPSVVTPRVRAWGPRRLDKNGTAQVSAAMTSGGTIPFGDFNVFYSWWDPVLEVGSTLVGLGNFTSMSGTATLVVTVGAHPDTHFTELKIFFEGTGDGTSVLAAEPDVEGDTAQIGVKKKREMATLNVNSAVNNITTIAGWTTLTQERLQRYGDGPYVASVLAEIDERPDSESGTFMSCTEHRGRMWVFGSYDEDATFTVLPSQIENPWCYDPFNALHIQGTGRPIAIRSAGDIICAFTSQGVWQITGEPGTTAYGAKKISDVAAVSRQAVRAVGNSIVFLAVDGLWRIQPDGVPARLTPQFTRYFTDQLDTVMQGKKIPQIMSNACMAFDTTRSLIYTGLPGVIQHLGGTPGPTAPTANRDLNDGLLVFSLQSGVLDWQIPDCPMSLAEIQVSDTTFEMWMGTPWGRMKRFVDGTLHGNATGSVKGTVTGGTLTTLLDSTDPFSDDATDLRGLSQWVDRFDGPTPTEMERRLVTETAVGELTVAPAFSNAPSGVATADTYALGSKWAWVEFGDWTAPSVDQSHVLTDLLLHLEAALDADVSIDASVADTLARQVASYSIGGTLAAASETVTRVSTEANAGYTQRLRLLVEQRGAGFRLWKISVMDEATGVEA